MRYKPWEINDEFLGKGSTLSYQHTSLYSELSYCSKWFKEVQGSSQEELLEIKKGSSLMRGTSVPPTDKTSSPVAWSRSSRTQLRDEGMWGQHDANIIHRIDFHPPDVSIYCIARILDISRPSRI